LTKYIMAKKTAWSAIAAMVFASATGLAQTTVPAAPSAPAPQAPAQVSFPKVDLKNFTADSPTVDEVNSFLKAMWGYDENRVWEVAACAGRGQDSDIYCGQDAAGERDVNRFLYDS